MAEFGSKLLAILDIKPAEKTRVLLLFCYLATLITVFMSARTVRDVLFLARLAKSALPFMYIAAGILVAVISTFYASLAKNLRIENLIIASNFTIAILLILHAAAIKLAGSTAAIISLYLIVEAVGVITVMQFWTLTAGLFDPREAKRLFPFIGSGGITASILCGFGTSFLFRLMSAEGVLIFCAALLLAASLGILYAFGPRAEVKAAAPKNTSKTPPSVPLFQNKYLRLIAIMAACTVLVSNIIDYEFKVIARSSFSEHDLPHFFGMFYGITGIISFAFQLTLSRVITRVYGVATALLFLPVALAGSSAVFLAIPGIIAITLGKASDTILKFSINDAATQMIYTPISGSQRVRVKAIIDGVIKPLCVGGTGIIFLVLGKVISEHYEHLVLASVAALLSGFWVLVLRYLKGEYVSTLMASLKQRRFNIEDSEEIDPNITAKILMQQLDNPDEADVLNALELLANLPAQEGFAAKLTHLLHAHSAKVRQTAIDLLRQFKGLQNSAQVLPLLADPDLEVRSRAINAYCDLAREDAIDEMRKLILSPLPEIKATTIAALLNYCGLEGMLLSAAELKNLMDSKNDGDRKIAAMTLSLLPNTLFARPLIQLCQDSSAEVARTAINAAAKLKRAEFLPTLISALENNELASAAESALMMFGATAAPGLADLVLASHPSWEKSLRVLSQIGQPQTFDMLSSILATDSEKKRKNLLTCLAHIRERHPEKVLAEKIVEDVLKYELNLCQKTEHQAGFFTPDDHLLVDALRSRIHQARERSYIALSLLFDRAGLNLFWHNFNGQARGYALELLDNLVSKELKPLALAIFEPETKATYLRQNNIAEVLKELLFDSNQWIKICAIHAVQSRGMRELIPQIHELREDHDILIRETSYFALNHLLTPHEYLSVLQKGIKDKDPELRTYLLNSLASLDLKERAA